jgi:hypothetical protein
MSWLRRRRQVEWLGRLGRGRHDDAWFVRAGAADVCIAKRVLCVGPEAQRHLTRLFDGSLGAATIRSSPSSVSLSTATRWCWFAPSIRG